jgi:TM2 domain-containing membrane protein YozV
MSQHPGAGWYPDPSGGPAQKYWDGRQWLESPSGQSAAAAAYGGVNYQGVNPYGPALSDKSKVAAGLLQLFLGGAGVGRFYLGYIGIGLAQLAITICTLGLAGWVWPLVDVILILTGRVTDAQGRTLRD